MAKAACAPSPTIVGVSNCTSRPTKSFHSPTCTFQRPPLTALVASAGSLVVEPSPRCVSADNTASNPNFWAADARYLTIPRAPTPSPSHEVRRAHGFHSQRPHAFGSRVPCRHFSAAAASASHFSDMAANLDACVAGAFAQLPLSAPDVVDSYDSTPYWVYAVRVPMPRLAPSHLVTTRPPRLPWCPPIQARHGLGVLPRSLSTRARTPPAPGSSREAVPWPHCRSRPQCLGWCPRGWAARIRRALVS